MTRSNQPVLLDAKLVDCVVEHILLSLDRTLPAQTSRQALHLLANRCCAWLHSSIGNAAHSRGEFQAFSSL